jgi:catechol 2,3-dioxygenase-like lactoylglutathione lyase family enzyme
MSLPPHAAAVAFVFTADRSRTLPFYRDVLGLPLIAEDPFAATFDLGGGTTLRLTDIKDHKPLPHTVLGWRVADIRAAMERLKRAGVSFETYEGIGQDADGVWSSEAAQIAWFLDPEGNNLSVTQFG